MGKLVAILFLVITVSSFACTDAIHALAGNSNVMVVSGARAPEIPFNKKLKIVVFYFAPMRTNGVFAISQPHELATWEKTMKEIQAQRLAMGGGDIEVTYVWTEAVKDQAEFQKLANEKAAGADVIVTNFHSNPTISSPSESDAADLSAGTFSGLNFKGSVLVLAGCNTGQCVYSAPMLREGRKHLDGTRVPRERRILEAAAADTNAQATVGYLRSTVDLDHLMMLQQLLLSQKPTLLSLGRVANAAPKDLKLPSVEALEKLKEGTDEEKKLYVEMIAVWKQNGTIVDRNVDDTLIDYLNSPLSSDGLKRLVIEYYLALDRTRFDEAIIAFISAKNKSAVAKIWLTDGELMKRLEGNAMALAELCRGEAENAGKLVAEMSTAQQLSFMLRGFPMAVNSKHTFHQYLSGMPQLDQNAGYVALHHAMMAALEKATLSEGDALLFAALKVVYQSELANIQPHIDILSLQGDEPSAGMEAFAKGLTADAKAKLKTSYYKHSGFSVPTYTDADLPQLIYPK